MRRLLDCAKHERALPTVVAAAFLARLVYSFFVFPKIGDALFWRGVDDGYDEIARNLLAGHGFVMSPGRPENLLIPPGYVYFLSWLYSLFGVEIGEGARLWVAHAALDAITCGALYAIGALVLENRRAGLLAAVAWALYPQMIVYSARVAPEVLFTLLFLALFVAWLALEARGGAWRALLAGAAWGALVLTKEKVILLPVLLLARLLWVRRREPARFLREGALFAVAALVVVGPWLYRGYALTGGFVPVTLRGGRALTEGFKKDFGGADTYMVDGFDQFYNEQGGRKPAFDSLTEEEREKQIRALREKESGRLRTTMNEIAHEPLTFLRRTAVRALAYWYWGQPRVILGNALINLPLLALGIAGIWLARQARAAAVAALLIAYMNAIHAVTVVRMRYSLPVMTLVILFASLAVCRAWSRWGPGRGEAAAPARKPGAAP